MTVKRIIVVLLVALMGVTGAWAEYVPYVDADGTVKVVNASEISSTPSPLKLEGGWFVVKGTDVQIPQIRYDGAVNIIIADGAQLTVTVTNQSYGSAIGLLYPGPRNSSSLTIYGQSAQTGRLTANGGKRGAGIGGDESAYGRNGSNITINGGIIVANGGSGAAGIGGGESGSGSNITINGGVVTANGGRNGGAGIGGGYGGSGFNITINGGTVTANSNEMSAAGIGGAGYSSTSVGTDITINGGNVTANGGDIASGIGGSSYGGSSNIFVTPALRVKADNNNPPANVIAHSSITDDISSLLNGKRYVRITNQALFKLRSSDSHKGEVFGVEDGEYARNTTLHFCAVPTDGYKFKGWSDGNTDNPRQYVLTDDVTITANFEVVFPEPTGTGPRMRVTKTDNKTFEFSVTDVKKVDFNSPN